MTPAGSRPASAAQVDRRLGVPAAVEHPALAGAQREDVPRPGEVPRLGRRSRRAPAACAPGRRRRCPSSRRDAASTETVYAVRSGPCCAASSSGRPSRSAISLVIGARRSRHEVCRIVQTPQLRRCFCWLRDRSPSFSRSSSSTTRTAAAPVRQCASIGRASTVRRSSRSAARSGSSAVGAALGALGPAARRRIPRARKPRRTRRARPTGSSGSAAAAVRRRGRPRSRPARSRSSRGPSRRSRRSSRRRSTRRTVVPPRRGEAGADDAKTHWHDERRRRPRSRPAAPAARARRPRGATRPRRRRRWLACALCHRYQP